MSIRIAELNFQFQFCLETFLFPFPYVSAATHMLLKILRFWCVCCAKDVWWWRKLTYTKLKREFDNFPSFFHYLAVSSETPQTRHHSASQTIITQENLNEIIFILTNNLDEVYFSIIFLLRFFTSQFSLPFLSLSLSVSSAHSDSRPFFYWHIWCLTAVWWGRLWDA